MQEGVSILCREVNEPAAILLIGNLPINLLHRLSGDIYVHLHVAPADLHIRVRRHMVGVPHTLTGAWIRIKHNILTVHLLNESVQVIPNLGNSTEKKKLSQSSITM
jgi:hypothetical protein